MDAPRVRRRASPGRRPGAGQLHAALPGPHVRRCSTCSRCMPSCWRSSVAWQAYIQDAPHLYVTAAIALRVQGDRHPGRAAPDRAAARHPPRRSRPWSASGRPCWPAWGWSRCRSWSCCRSPAGADPLAREDLAFALSVVLLGLLMMVTRRNAVSQVVGFMSMENGLILAATGAKGMPLVVEISIAFSVLIAFIVIGIFLFRIRERFDTVDVQALDDVPRRAPVNALGSTALVAVLAVPARGRRAARPAAGLSAERAAQRRSPRCSRCSRRSLLFATRPEPGRYLLVDDLNVVFIVLNTFVGFTTSVFSAELHRARAGDRPPDRRLPALLSRDVPDC